MATEKDVLVEVEKEFRIIQYNDMNLVLEVWKEEVLDNKGEVSRAEGYRSEGYYGTVAACFRALLKRDLLFNPETDKRVEGALEQIKQIENKLEEALRGMK